MGSAICCCCCRTQTRKQKSGRGRENQGRDWPVYQGVSEGLRITERRAVEHCDVQSRWHCLRAGQSKYPEHSPHRCLDIPGDWEDVPIFCLVFELQLFGFVTVFLPFCPFFFSKCLPPGYGPFLTLLHPPCYFLRTNCAVRYRISNELGGCSRQIL